MHGRLLDGETFDALLDDQLDDGLRRLIGAGRGGDLLQHVHLFKGLPQTPILLFEWAGVVVGALHGCRHVVPLPMRAGSRRPQF